MENWNEIVCSVYLCLCWLSWYLINKLIHFIVRFVALLLPSVTVKHFQNYIHLINCSWNLSLDISWCIWYEYIFTLQNKDVNFNPDTLRYKWYWCTHSHIWHCLYVYVFNTQMASSLQTLVKKYEIFTNKYCHFITSCSKSEIRCVVETAVSILPTNPCSCCYMASFITYHYLRKLYSWQCSASAVTNVRYKVLWPAVSKLQLSLSVCSHNVHILHSVSMACFLSLMK